MKMALHSSRQLLSFLNHRLPQTFRSVRLCQLLLLLQLLLLAPKNSLADDAHEMRNVHLATQVTSEDTNGGFFIDTYEKALMYLKKYDYLNCTLVLSKRKRRDVDQMMPFFEVNELLATVTHEPSSLPLCNDLDIFAAFVEFQQKFDLPITGSFNDDTARLMSAGRCGNTDHDHQSPDEETNTVKSALLTNARRKNEHIDGDAPHHSVRRRAANLLLRKKHEVGNNGAVHQSHFNIDVGLRQLMWRKATERIQRRYSRGQRRNGPLFEAEEAEVSDVFGTQEAAEKKEAQSTGMHQWMRIRKRRETLAPSENYTVNEELLSGIYTKFNKEYGQPITWRVLEMAHSAKIREAELREIMQTAFRIWSEVTPVVFEEKNTGPIDMVDIEIGFGKLRHLDCRHPFDGRGGELAHSSQTTAHKVIHFDDDECFKAATAVGQPCLNLLPVAIHEIGHVLGLPHSESRQSIMFPVYDHSKKNSEYELSTDDRRSIQGIYGVCKRGDFSVVWDWLRRRDVPGSTTPRYYYNTYFARDRWFWMYENRNNRTRYGDPMTIANGWPGLPATIDAYCQVLRRDVLGHYGIETYFFSGSKYYRYDDREDKVMNGFPRDISTDFGPKPGSNESIPNDLDAAFFDQRDHLIYFFKDEWVWVFNPKDANDPTRGCCERKVRFRDLFPMLKREELVLTGNVDTVYYSFAHQGMYMFKGADVYLNAFYLNGPSRNMLVKVNPWYVYWKDICDVQPTT